MDAKSQVKSEIKETPPPLLESKIPSERDLLLSDVFTSSIFQGIFP